MIDVFASGFLSRDQVSSSSPPAESSILSSSLFSASSTMDTKVATLDIIQKKLHALEEVQKSSRELFAKIEAKLADNRLGQEMIIQFKKRCMDKISILKSLLPNLERKVLEGENYKSLMSSFRRLMELRKNETESLIHDISHIATDLTDSIHLELARLVDTLIRRDYDDLSAKFGWQTMLGLIKRLDRTKQ